MNFILSNATNYFSTIGLIVAYGMTYLLEQKRGLMIFGQNLVILTIISELMISCVANLISIFITLN